MCSSCEFSVPKYLFYLEEVTIRIRIFTCTVKFLKFRTVKYKKTSKNRPFETKEHQKTKLPQIEHHLLEPVLDSTPLCVTDDFSHVIVK